MIDGTICWSRWLAEPGLGLVRRLRPVFVASLIKRTMTALPPLRMPGHGHRDYSRMLVCITRKHLNLAEYLILAFSHSVQNNNIRITGYNIEDTQTPSHNGIC